MKPFNMQEILILLAIGLIAGILSGFVGVGGGIIIVPALIYFLQFTQLLAQGTSLAVLFLPVGILGIMNYYKAGNIDVRSALVIAAAFVFGSYFGSKYALKLPDFKIKFFFSLLLLYVAIKMLWSSGNQWFGKP